MSGPTTPPMPGHGVTINGPGPQDWFATYETVTVVVLAALPVAVLAVWLLARRRRRAGWETPWAWRASLAEVGLLAGSLPWLWLTMLPAGGGAGGPGAVSLVPLRDLATMPPYQVVGNLAVLAALGALGPVRFAALASVPRIALLASTCSVLIECAQHLLRLDRVSSVDDVLLNTIGAVVAAALSSPWWRAGPEKSSPDLSHDGPRRCLDVDSTIDA